MQPTPNCALLVSAAVLATLALPSAASSQYRLPTITSVAKADSIHASAIAMTRNFNRWRDAARLHRRSAELRPAEDSLAYRCLVKAAHLSYAKEDLMNAQSDMAAAAAQALARGDVEKAALAYADAAWVANERKRQGDVLTLAHQAEVLASSPLLSGTQRSGILRRFVHTGPDLAVQAER